MLTTHEMSGRVWKEMGADDSLGIGLVVLEMEVFLGCLCGLRKE